MIASRRASASPPAGSPLPERGRDLQSRPVQRPVVGAGKGPAHGSGRLRPGHRRRPQPASLPGGDGGGAAGVAGPTQQVHDSRRDVLETPAGDHVLRERRVREPGRIGRVGHPGGEAAFLHRQRQRRIETRGPEDGGRAGAGGGRRRSSVGVTRQRHREDDRQRRREAGEGGGHGGSFHIGQWGSRAVGIVTTVGRGYPPPGPRALLRHGPFRPTERCRNPRGADAAAGVATGQWARKTRPV